MKKYITAALLVVIITLALDPLIRELAIAERGNNATGAEFLFFPFSMIIAFLIVEAGRKKVAIRSEESEEAENVECLESRTTIKSR